MCVYLFVCVRLRLGVCVLVNTKLYMQYMYVYMVRGADCDRAALANTNQHAREL